MLKMLMSKWWFWVLLIAVIGTYYKERNTYSVNSNSSSEGIHTETQQKEVVNVDDANECLFYLKGKTFYGGNVKLEFLYDGNVGVYNKSTNELAYTGYTEIAEKYGQASRRLKIKSTTGNDAVKLMLGNDGKIMDETDFTIYKTNL